jgi:glycosyltransferase involved in cell wall biosynthesis
LAYFGQVRPYKGVEELVSCARGMNGKGLFLTVVGQRRDADLARRIAAIAADAPNIRCDLREGLVPDADLEAGIDAAHAVVLPYRNILNSGAALLALSRNRPILAPRVGSLIELQAAVGEDWVHLYEGDLSVAVLEEFVTWIRRRSAPETCDLSAFDWPPIGAKLRAFIQSLRSA